MTSGPDNIHVIIAAAQNGDRRAASRLMTLVTWRDKKALRQVRKAATNLPFVIGVTGDGGSGKTSLIVELIKHFRAKGEAVGIISFEPVDYPSGGAALHDRGRMTKEQAVDPGIFFRSIAVRRPADGIDACAPDLCAVFGLLGTPVVFLETMGTAQGQIGIQKSADLIIFTVDPSSGDWFQVTKDGRFLIADIVCVTKAAASSHAERMAHLITNEFDIMQEARRNTAAHKNKLPVVVLTDVKNGRGIEEVFTALKNNPSPNMSQKRKARQS